MFDIHSIHAISWNAALTEELRAIGRVGLVVLRGRGPPPTEYLSRKKGEEKMRKESAKGSGERTSSPFLLPPVSHIAQLTAMPDDLDWALWSSFAAPPTPSAALSLLMI